MTLLEQLRRNAEACAKGINSPAIGSDPAHYLTGMAADRIEQLRDHLSQALRQWRMYAELHDEVDLEHDDSAEALLYRELFSALTVEQGQK